MTTKAKPARKRPVRDRVVQMDIRFVAGVCFVCACTEDLACHDANGVCWWVDAENTLCSACERIGLLFMEWMVAKARP